MYSDVRAGVTAVAQKAQELGLKGTIANTLEQTSKALSNTWDTIKNTPNALWNALAKVPAQVKEDVYGSDGGHGPTNLENSFAFGQTPTGSLMGDIVAGALAKAFSTGVKAVEPAGGMKTTQGLPKKAIKAGKNTSYELTQIAEQIMTFTRRGSGLKGDASHRAASFVSKEQLQAGKVFSITGHDGVSRKLLQTSGIVNGKPGVFEYIIDPSKTITHQRFIQGGKITGTPNQKVIK